jgi:hypothetical protein
MSGTPKLGTGYSSLTPLWSGRRAALDDPRHWDLPLLNGYLPYCTPQGSCEIRGASPNLWFAVLPALGFRILSIRFPAGPFVDLCGFFCPGALALATTPRRCNRLPNVVFLDLLSLPSVSRLTTSYWRAWEVPHIFFVSGGNLDLGAPAGRGRFAQVAPLPPPGWTVRDIGLSHCEAGGGTLGSCRLVVWYQPAQSTPSPSPLVPLPWFPIRSLVMDRLAATLVQADLAPADALPVAAVVRCMADGAYEGCNLMIGAVQQWGLFPASALSTPVLLSAAGSFTGLGVRSLSWPELAALWDVPILISDRLTQPSDVELLRGFCSSAPAKVLFVGADVLLTTSFRGGSISFGG